MLSDSKIVDKIEKGKFKTLNNMIVVKRDPKPETVGSLGILLGAQTSYISSNWATIKSLPKKILVNGKKVKPNLQIGQRIFIRPLDSESLVDLVPEYQSIHYNHIEAVEVDGEIVPFNHRVFVKAKEKETMTAGGLYLPDNIDIDSSGKFVPTLISMPNDPGLGIVTKVGDSVQEDISLGDFVFYEPLTHPVVEINNEKFIIIKEDKILGIKE